MLVRYKRNKKVAYYHADSLSSAPKDEPPIQRPRGPFVSCGECPYAAHGFICYSSEGDCMRTDMQRISGRKK